MRFYQNSTLGDVPHAKSLSLSQSTSTSQTQDPRLACPTPIFLCHFSHFTSQFVELSNLLSQQLIYNAELIDCRANLLPPYPTHPTPAQLPPTKELSEQNSTRSSQEDQKSKREERMSKQKRRKIVESDSEDSYRPLEDWSKEQGPPVSESKNIPKNYGKAIINFIRNNEAFVTRTLSRLNLDPAEFWQSLSSLKNNLSTISQLRNLWLSSNKFSAAYRIFSAQYVRRHSLSYIFNSRVENFHKHIKYRYKILQGIADPQQFTCMKQF